MFSARRKVSRRTVRFADNLTQVLILGGDGVVDDEGGGGGAGTR